MQSQKQKSSTDCKILSLSLFGFHFILFVGLGRVSLNNFVASWISGNLGAQVLGLFPLTPSV